MEKLISMVAFVLDKIKSSDTENLSYIINYALFLSQKLEIWMFIPCKLVDGVWVVLEEPKGVKCCGGIQNDCDCRGELQYDEELFKEYQEAKKRILFEGFEFKKQNMISKENKIELFFDIYFDKDQPKLYDGKEMFLLNTLENLIIHSVELTPTAQKQIGL